MFFNEEEMKIAEDMAWKMLDGWNHSYMPNLDDYAHFYFRDGHCLFQRMSMM